jgi:general secretion pathway protein K
MKCRAGFALLAAMWIVVALAMLGFGISLAARQGIGTTRNRIELVRADWLAQGCLADARVRISHTLLGSTDVDVTAAWSNMDRSIEGPSDQGQSCRLEVRAAGSRLNVNVADSQTLNRLFFHLGTADKQRDSLVAALLDWRDADDDARPAGAERDWYLKHNLRTPRNGAFADIREMARVRGFEKLDVDSVLDVEPGRIDVNHAPLAVVASLPGFGSEAIGHLNELRARRERVIDLSTFGSEMSPDGKQQLLMSYDDLTHVLTYEPDAWIVTARSASGSPPISVAIEARFARSGTRAAVVRLRSWIE